MTCNLMNHEEALKNAFNIVFNSTTGNEWYIFLNYLFNLITGVFLIMMENRI